MRKINSKLIVKWVLIIGFSLLFVLGSFFIPLYFLQHDVLCGCDGQEVVGIFGLTVTSIGAVLVILQLDENKRVTCCSMLSDMNMKFIENERMMNLYQELCRCVQDPNYHLTVSYNSSKSTDIHPSDLLAYMTFYEVINEYVQNGVMTIEQMDDMFGDRFFKLIHNPYVQEHELYAEPSSYVNIFQLYETWSRYRKAEAKRNKNRYVVLSENEIPEYYIDKKLYLWETTQFFMNESIELTNKKGEQKTLKMQRLLPKHLEIVETFQRERILANIQDPNIFAKSEKEEFLESMLIDFCYGLFDGDRLVAVCICVLNRKTKVTGGHERNLCVLTSEPKEYQKYVTFDTIQVDPDYRGYGIQNFFLGKAEEVAGKVEASCLIATVSPDNPPSLNMFKKNGYLSYTEKPLAMYGAERWLMVKKNEKLSQ